MKFFLLLLIALPLVGRTAHGQDAGTDALAREREQQTGTAITILFDNSGSMRGEKIQQAKAAFRSWLQTVPDDYKYSLITFENNGRLVVPLGEHTRDAIAQRVAKLEANTGTPICGALRIAREQIEKRRREVTPYERHVVLIFTDGQETTDPRGADGVRADIAALRKQTVEVVGVGFHGEGDYMNGVATRFALANNEQELKQGLAKVDAEVGSVDDLVVSPEDLAALKQFEAPPVQPISATASTEASAPPAPAPTKRGFNMTWIITAMIAWVVLPRDLSVPETVPLMRKVVVALSIFAIVAMIAWKITQPIREKKARSAELLLTSDAANLDRVVRVWGDDWLGYLIFRSRRFQKEMQQYRLGVRFDLVFDFKERFRGLEKGDCDFVAATIDSYLANGQESGFPGVITWVIDESYGADAIIGGPKVKSVDALNQPDLKGALVGFSPSEFLLKAQIANFRMNALLPRVASFRVDKEEDAYAALAKGKADFAVLWEPFVSQALKEINGTTRVLDSSQTKGVIVDVAIASRKTLAADPELANKVSRAYFNALNYYLDHADEFRELAAADSKKDVSTATTMLNGVKFVPFAENTRTWFGLDDKLPEDGLVDAINRIARILGEVGDLKGDPLNANPFSIVNSKPLRTLYEAPAELLANEVKTAGSTPMPGGAAFFRRLSDEEWQHVASKVVGTLVDEPILFGSGSAGVPEDFQPALRDAIYKLAHYPKYRVIVSGYVSPGSDPQADQQLSEERAQVIKRYLVEQGGVQEDRIYAQGLGSTELPAKSPDESDAAWKRRARRARIYLAQE